MLNKSKAKRKLLAQKATCGKILPEIAQNDKLKTLTHT